MILFGKDATSFSHLDLGILCHSSLQILSSSVRLDGKRWWTVIFRSLQRCSIGFKSGLWLGHSRTVTELLWSHSFVILAVCLGSLSFWKVNLRPSLRSWALWRRFSSRISLYLAAFIFPSIATSRPVPAAEKHLHSMMLPPSCFTVGTVLDRWWAVPGFPESIEYFPYPLYMPHRTTQHAHRKSRVRSNNAPTRKVYVTLVYLLLFAVGSLCCDMLWYSWSGQRW